jgi:ABC-type multidrug transport system fused ATPase/permease subunit
MFSLDLFFPIGNVMRSMLVGLNVDVIDCRDNNARITYGGSIYAYGGPILYLCIQCAFYLWLLVYLESRPTAASRIFHSDRSKSEKTTIEHNEEVTEEKNRVEGAEKDLLQILHLTKSFGQNVAVEDITFGVGEGEIFALLGPNGAGKSSIVNMIRGQLVPDNGTIMLQGTNIVQNLRSGQRHLGGKFLSTILYYYSPANQF